MPRAQGTDAVPSERGHGSRYAAFDFALRARRGARLLAGVDEAGRGPLAGPVVAAAVVLPPVPLPLLAGVRDSKRLAPARREELFPAVLACAVEVGVGWAEPEEIDARNILRASLLAMRRALGRLRLDREGLLVVVDGDRLVPELDAAQEALVAADAFSLSVASASIVAKVVRDRWMKRLDRDFPGYGFARHKGYGTSEHYEALARLGPAPAHRRSFLRSHYELTLPL